MTIASPRPRQGQLQFLRTKAEVSATEDIGKSPFMPKTALRRTH